MTNGEMIQKVFYCKVCEPIPEDDIIHVIFPFKNDSVIGFDWSWWNAEYEEPAPDIDKCIEKLKHEKQCFIDGLWANDGEIEAYDMAIDTMNKFKVLFQIMKDWAVSVHPELTKMEYFDKIVELMNEKGK